MTASREPSLAHVGQLTWDIAAALVRSWPRALGRSVELHRAGGHYDEIQLQLQPIRDRQLDWPSPQPRISLNRFGSL